MYSLLHCGSTCCGSCKFFKRLNVAEETDAEIDVEEFSAEVVEEYGRCVRHPPTFFHPGLLNAEFPVVKASMWCGEFKRDIE